MNSPNENGSGSRALRRVDGGRRLQASGGAQASSGGSLAAPAQMSPKFLIWVLARSWKVVVPVGLLLAGVAAASLLYNYNPSYQATAILKIEDRSNGLLFNGGSIGPGNQRFVRTQMEILRSDPVLLSVIADKKVGSISHVSHAKDRLAAIRQRLSISSIGGSELYQVRYTAPSPDDAQVVTAAVIEKYFEKMDDDDRRRHGSLIDLLTDLEEKKALELKEKQQRVVQLAKDVTGRDPFTGSITDLDTAINPLASLRGRLANLEVQEEVLNAEHKAIQQDRIVARDPAEVRGLLEMHVQQDDRIVAIKKRVEALKQLKENLEKQFVDPVSRPEYQDTLTALEDYEAAYTETEQFVRDDLVARSDKERKAEAALAVRDTQRKLLRLQHEHAAVKRQYDAELSKMRDGGGRSAELEIAKAELARHSRVHEMIASKILSLKTEAQTPPKITLFSPPSASPVPIESAPWKKLFLACGIAMAAPFGIALLREASLRRVMDAEQLYGDTQLRVLGEIASFPTRRVAANPRQLPRALRREMYAFAESIDALRLSLTHVTQEKEGASVYALTSGVSGEGKTSVSVALAMSFANVTGTRTLLIDGDLRAPGVQDLLDLKYTPGLSEVLAGRCKVNEAIQQASGIEGLFVIRAGDCEKSPHSLVRPGRLGELMSFLRANFDVIVVDTPPVLGASESLSLCAAADATAVCSLRGVSRLRQFRLAVDKLDTAGAVVVGSVLSGIPTHGYGYAYAYGYGFRDSSPEHLEAPHAV